MDMTSEVLLWVMSLVIGFIFGWLTNWHFYKKQRKENEVNAELLKQIQQSTGALEQYVGAQIRLGDDKRGKIVKRPDGTIVIEWQVSLPSSVTVSAKPQIEVKRKEE